MARASVPGERGEVGVRGGGVKGDCEGDEWGGGGRGERGWERGVEREREG